MLTFIKNLLGFGSADSYTPKETVKEILTPPADYVVAKSDATSIEPAKPIAKVRAIVESGPDAVKAAHAAKSANKKRRPRNRNRAAGGTVAKLGNSLAKAGVSPSSITEGNTKGGNGQVKPAQVTTAKPAKPKSPVAKKK